MKVEIWNKDPTTGEFTKTYTLDLHSTTDEAVCELAYFHTTAGTITQMREDWPNPTAGDRFVVKDEEECGECGDARVYELLKLPDADASSVQFRLIQE